MSTAVLYELSSEARNSARSAISCGRPKRPSNDLCENVARPFRTTELPSRVPSLSGPARRRGTVDRPRGHWRLSVGGARKPLCHDRRPRRVAATAVSRRRTASSSDHRDPARTAHLVRDEVGGPSKGGAADLAPTWRWTVTSGSSAGWNFDLVPGCTRWGFCGKGDSVPRG